MNNQRLTNQQLRKDYNISKNFSSEDLLKRLPPFENDLFNFIAKCCEKVDYISFSMYNVREFFEKVIFNLFSSHHKLTLFQCVYRGVFNINRQERKKLLRLFLEEDVEKTIMQLFKDIASFQENFVKIKTFTSSKELLVKYIQHVGFCEGCTYLYEDSPYLSFSEKYYIIKLEEKYNP